MKVLVVGGGSIGRRHLRNLKLLGVEDLGLVESDDARRADLVSELSARSFSTLEQGIDWQPDFVIVATPNHLHAQQTLSVVRAGLHVFVEKPLCHSPSGLDEIVDIVTRKNLISIVGCNMRFHPGPAKVKELLSGSRIGKVLFARVHAGSYLPDWRRGVDYRNNYAAREETGGGCLLDFIHEIDLTRWYLGDVVDVFCMGGHMSALEITTEDVAALVCRHTSGAISEIHVDYVQRTYERGCQIVGESGTIFWDFMGKQVRWFNAADGQSTLFDQSPSWEVNDIYVEEMKHFIDCVRKHRSSVLPIPDAAAVMQIVFAAKTSMREGKLVSTTTGVAA